MNAKTFSKRTMLLLSLALIAVSLFAISAEAQQTAAKIPFAVALSYRGDVQYQRGNSWIDFHTNLAFEDGDKIRTGDDGYCALMFMDDKSQIRLNPNTEASIGRTANQNNTWDKRIDMELGNVFAKVTEQKGSLQVATPTAVASVKGTEFWVMMNPDGSVTQITLEGVVELLSLLTGETEDVAAGYQGDVDDQGNIEVSVLDPDDVPKYLNAAEVETIRIRFIDENGNEKTLIIPITIE